MQNPRKPILIFLALCLLCSIGVGTYLHRLRLRAAPPSQAENVPSLQATNTASPRILFRYTGLDANYGRIAVAEQTNLSAPRFVGQLAGEVVYFAAGQGICLQADRGVLTTYAAQIFDSDFQPRFTIPLRGGPSRARVSPDGTLAGVTVFLTGHGYASLNFSTEALLIETGTGKILAALESDLQVTRDGKPFKAKDFNFWGITFTPDSKRFYCTLSSQQKHYLLEADIATRTARVIHENVECPSVSPDGLRVAYKKRFIMAGRLVWQLHILDLATGRETALSEKRSVDDQIEWLDNAHVLYAVSDNPEGASAVTNVWKADAAGSRPPEMYLAKAYSPAVVR